MNSEMESSLELLKSISKLVDITSKYADESNEELFEELKRDTHDPWKDTETIFNDSLSSLIKLSSVVGRENQFELSIRNLYNTMIKTHKEEEESLTVAQEGGDDFKLAKITISVSDQIDDNRSSDKDNGTTENEAKKSKKKRQRLDNSTKEFLERVFEKKSQPNRRERELIAEKYGISLPQIRVWFTNKRMRKKKPDSTKNESGTSKKS
ncbi:Mating-type-like protein A1 [Candida viswanathii]|uniref:Mating-type-like protein A1 n=1 Tax=Candida viswanathii TaxID=5486 RepID=A0A367YH87_9ASCO|nr:Mating-type-like protein A1 [Candida viswanathii]